MIIPAKFIKSFKVNYLPLRNKVLRDEVWMAHPMLVVEDREDLAEMLMTAQAPEEAVVVDVGVHEKEAHLLRNTAASLAKEQ